MAHKSNITAPGKKSPASSISRKARILVWLRRISQAAFLFMFFFMLWRTEYRGGLSPVSKAKRAALSALHSGFAVQRTVNHILARSSGTILPIATFTATLNTVEKIQARKLHYKKAQFDIKAEFFFKIDPLISISVALSEKRLPRGLFWGLLILALTIFLGRFFCGWLCPMGTLNHIISAILPSRKGGRRIKANRNRPYQKVKYYLLIGVLTASFFTTLQIGLLDPICLATRSFGTAILPAIDHGLREGLDALHGTDITFLKYISYGGYYIFDGNLIAARPAQYHWGWLIGFIFLALLFLNRIIPRFFCRALCPLGALMGLFSRFSLLGLEKKEALCTNCNKCLLHCQGADDPIPGKVWRKAECHLCMNCEAACPEGALRFKFFPNRKETLIKADLNRRHVLTATFSGLAFFPLVRISDQVRNNYHPRLIRPPGAREEKAFLARCLKCGACMKVCPNNALQPTLFEAGLEGLWTPILIPRIGSCEYGCTLCSKVCPTHAIQPITVEEKIGAGKYKGKPIRLGTAFYDYGRCLPWAMKTPCIVCEEVCPTSPKAIWYEEDWIVKEGKRIRLQKPRIDPTLCIGCGTCEKNCPVHDKPAVYVTAIGESRSRERRLLLASGPRRINKKGHQARPSSPKQHSSKTPLKKETAPPIKKQTTTNSSDELERLIVDCDKQPGWTRSGPLKIFTKTNLFDHVNGAAPTYFEHGFSHVLVANYQQLTDSGKTLAVELYHMGSSLGAFGRYSTERDPSARFATIGAEGFLGGGSLVFWKGPLLIKMTAYEDSPKIDRQLTALGKKIAARISGATKLPSAFTHFPGKGLIPHTERIEPRALLGHKFLGRGFEAEYRFGKDRATLFSAQYQSKEAALSAFKAIQSKYGEQGKLKSLKGWGDKAFTAPEERGKSIALYIKGRYLAGAIGRKAVKYIRGFTLP